MNNIYNTNYFSSHIFEFDYPAIADAIIQQYQPKSIIEFGCGNGDLARSFAAKGIAVEAIDGYSNPDFTNYSNIRFHKIDLNNESATKEFLNQYDRKFDLAISIEVVEHLNPSISFAFIEWMTSMSDVIVFSAAVPKQDGEGHINCRSRQEWYKLIQQQEFLIADNLRQYFIINSSLGLWHKFNIIDYVHFDSDFAKKIDIKVLVERLISAESFAASQCFYYLKQTQQRQNILNLNPVKFAVKFRNFLLRLAGKKPLGID